MLFKKVIEKYYTDESQNIQSSTNNQLVNHSLNNSYVNANVNANANANPNVNTNVNTNNLYMGQLQNGNRHFHTIPPVGFETNLIQKFTFDILEEINEIEEERRRKEMREREELSQLRYLELQRILYNLQFNSKGELNRETRAQLKDMILNMTIDDLKNKYKTDINSGIKTSVSVKKQHNQQGVCSGETQSPTQTSAQSPTQTSTQNKNDSSRLESNNLYTESNTVSDLLETPNSAENGSLGEESVQTEHAGLKENNLHEDELYSSSGKRLVDSVNNLFTIDAEKDPDYYIKMCTTAAPSQIYTMEKLDNPDNLNGSSNLEKNDSAEASVSLDDINLDEIQVVKTKKIKDLSYNGKKRQFISIDNVIYPSLKDASAKLNMNKATILWRLKSNNEKFDNYIYVDAVDADEISSIHENQTDSELDKVKVHNSNLAAAA